MTSQMRDEQRIHGRENMQVVKVVQKKMVPERGIDTSV